MQRLESLLTVIAQRRIGFRLDELMTGTHHFLDDWGPAGEHPMSFKVTWGADRLLPYLNPLGVGFLSNDLAGTVTVGGLVQDAACRGKLELLYFSEAKIRYGFTFEDGQGRTFQYLGEKVNLRPWNLHRTHTTCYGAITEVATGREVSRSILYFRLWTLPAFLKSFRLA